MAISWGLPKLVSKILEAVPAINYLLNALAKMDYTGTENVPTGAIRLESLSGGYQLQRYNGTSWVSIGKLIHDAETVDGKSASTTATADTIPVRDSSGKVPGDITGNAASADIADGLSATLPISKGGTGATSAANARSNLGVPPTSHASSGTTYGLASARVYGHAMATSDAPAQDTDAGSVGSDVTHFARGDHAHKKVLGTSTVYGQVKLTDSVTSTSEASSHIGASAKAVKTAYDKAVDAKTAADAASKNSETADKLTTAKIIDGISFDGSASIVRYATCSTAAGTAAKTVTMSGFTLVIGAVIFVRFTVTNTALNPTLNVNGTGSKAIQYRNASISASCLAANRTYAFVYDGSSYELVGDIDTSLSIATQDDAEAGTNNTKAMTPLRVAEQLEKYMPKSTVSDGVGRITTVIGTGYRVTLPDGGTWMWFGSCAFRSDYNYWQTKTLLSGVSAGGTVITFSDTSAGSCSVVCWRIS